ncbi:MAG: hypothetical protein AB7I04_01590 [Pseudomonadales bacterium]
MRTLVLVMIGLLMAGTAGAHGRDADSKSQGYRSHLVSKSYGHQKWHYSKHTNYRYQAGSRLDALFNSKLNSGVCDSLADATPGLRLMCMAFCEMQTCEPDFTLENPFQNCSKSSRWIYDRYEARRGPGDPDMPCVQQPQAAPECPCWSPNELAGYRYPAATDLPSCFANLSSKGIVNMDSWRIYSEDGVSYQTSLTSSEMDADGVPSCQVRDKVCDPLTGACTTSSRYMALTPEQFAACEADVAQSALDRGIICNPM